MSAAPTHEAVPSEMLTPGTGIRNLVVLGVCLTLAFAAFSPSVATGTFINHEDSCLKLSPVANVRNIPSIFTQDFMMFTDGQFRPFSYAVLALGRTFVGADNVIFWHAWLVLFHGLNGFLLYLLVRRFAARQVPALMAAGIFLLHPLASVFANHIDEFHHVLGGTLFLGSFLLYIDATKRSGIRTYVASALVFAAGLLTAKSVAALPLLILAYEIFYCRSRVSTLAKRLAAFVVLLLLMVPAWTLLTPNRFFFEYPGYSTSGIWYSLCSTITAGWHYALALVTGWGIPAPLVERTIRMTQPFHWQSILSLMTLGAIIFLAILALRKKHWLGLGLLAMPIAMIPYSNTAFNVVMDFVSWSYLYIPLAGFAIFAGGCFEWMLQKTSNRPERVALSAALAMLIAMFALFLLSNNVSSRTARTYWQKALSANPESEIACVALGRAYLDEDNLDEALAYLYSPVVTKLPESCLAMTRYYCRKKQIFAASLHMRYSVDAIIGDYRLQNEALNVLAELTTDLGMIDYTEDALARLMLRDPFSTRAMRRLAKVFVRKGHVRAAVRWLEYAARLEPDNEATRSLLNETRPLLRRPEIPVDTKLTTLRSPGELRYASAGPVTDHIRQLVVELAKDHPKDPIIQMEAGIRYAEMGSDKISLGHEKLVMATNSLTSYPYAWASRCYVAHLLGHRGKKALEVASHAAYLNPTNETILGILASLTNTREELDQAISYYNNIIATQPNPGRHHATLASLLMRKGDFKLAVDHLRKAIKAGAGEASVRNNLGAALIALGNFDEAIESFRKAIAIDPDDVRIHWDLSNALWACGRYGDAARALAEGLKRFPDDMNLQALAVEMMATCPDGRFRDGGKALALALDMYKKSTRDPDGSTRPATAAMLNILATAYAENNQYQKAAEIATQALRIARSQNKRTLAGSIEQRLERFKKSRPFRASPAQRR